MSLVDQIVRVNVQLSGVALTRKGFGTPLIVGYHTLWDDLIREYPPGEDGLAALRDDGFGTDDPIYMSASALNSARNKVRAFKVGRLARRLNEVYRVQIGDVEPGDTYQLSVRILGLFTVTVSYQAGPQDTLSVIATGLVTALRDELGPPFPVSDPTDGGFTISSASNSPFSVTSAAPRLLRVTEDVESPDLETVLGAMADEDPEFYAVLLAQSWGSAILDAARWVEASERLLVARSADPANTNGGESDTAARANILGYDRTAIVHTHDPFNHTDAAWAGLMLPKDPGTATWGLKRLTGVEPSKLTAPQINVLAAKKANHYTRGAGINVMRQGTVASGEWIDVIRGVDALKAAIQENVVVTLVAAEKVAFTDAGLQLLYASIDQAVSRFTGDEALLAPGSVVIEIPEVRSIPEQERRKRVLRGIRVRGRFSGAVHKAEIDVSLTP